MPGDADVEIVNVSGPTLSTPDELAHAVNTSATAIKNGDLMVLLEKIK